MSTHTQLQRMADLLSSTINKNNASESQMARAVGVTHPTLGRMLHPERAGSEGVAIQHWLRALQVSGSLDRFVTQLEEGVRQQCEAAGIRFKPDNEMPLRSVDAALSAPSEGDKERVEAAQFRIGEALRASLEGSNIRYARRLASAMGVTSPTLMNLLNPVGTHAGGTAIKHFFSAADRLGLGPCLEKGLPPLAPQVPQHRNERHFQPAPSPSL